MKLILNNFISIVTLAAIFSLGGITSTNTLAAPDNITYFDSQTNTANTISTYSLLQSDSSGSQILSSGWYYVNGAATVTTTDLAIGAGQTVNIIIGKGAKLNAEGSNFNAGINVPSGTTLSIYAEADISGNFPAPAQPLGWVNATASNFAACIGGNGSNYVNNGQDSGTINIYGGNVYVYCRSNSYCTGIGGGGGLNGGDSGIVRIFGGSLNISGGYGAAIGGGYGMMNGGSGGEVFISGGIVYAEGNTTGIGGGSGDDVGGAGGILTITGGIVSAAGYLSSGIGGGYSDWGIGGESGDITITGGAVSANTNSYRGYDIGAGYGRDGNGSVGNIHIASGVDAITISASTVYSAKFFDQIGNSINLKYTTEEIILPKINEWSAKYSNTYASGVVNFKWSDNKTNSINPVFPANPGTNITISSPLSDFYMVDISYSGDFSLVNSIGVKNNIRTSFISVYNNTNSDETATLIVLTYSKDNRLTDVKTQIITVASFKSRQFDFTVPTDGTSQTVCIWDDINTMKPLALAVRKPL